MSSITRRAFVGLLATTAAVGTGQATADAGKQNPSAVTTRDTTGYGEGGYDEGRYGGGDTDDGSNPLSATRSLSSSEIPPGGSVTVTLEGTAQADAFTFREQVDPAVDSATFQSATVNDTTVSNPTLSSADANGAVVTLSNLQSGDTVTATYTMSVADSATIGDTIDISGKATSGDQTDVPLSTDTLTVAEGSPLDPPVARYDTDKDGEITIVELGGAASDYASGEIGITELGKVASVYASS